MPDECPRPQPPPADPPARWADRRLMLRIRAWYPSWRTFVGHNALPAGDQLVVCVLSSVDW